MSGVKVDELVVEYSENSWCCVDGCVGGLAAGTNENVLLPNLSQNPENNQHPTIRLIYPDCLIIYLIPA